MDVPCVFCGRAQEDPVRGASPWHVGVRGRVQVLVCPQCQRAHDMQAELLRCPSCGSVKMRRQLGATVCRECGWESPMEEWDA